MGEKKKKPKNLQRVTQGRCDDSPVSNNVIISRHIITCYSNILLLYTDAGQYFFHGGSLFQFIFCN